MHYQTLQLLCVYARMCVHACECARTCVCVCHYEKKIAVVVLLFHWDCRAVAIHPDHAVGKVSLCCRQ